MSPFLQNPLGRFAGFALLACFSRGEAMIYQPFVYCTGNSQADSIRTWVYRDAAMDPAGAPYQSWARFHYHAGTCIVSEGAFKAYYLDSSLAYTSVLSPDHRVLETTWNPIGERPSIRSTTWYSAQGQQDSVRYLAPELDPDTDSLFWTGSFLRIGRKPTYETWKEWDIRWDGVEELMATDSVVPSSGGFTVYTTEIIFTMDVEVKTVTTCVRTAASLTCTPREVGEVTSDLETTTWFLTEGKVDSVRTYGSDGKLNSVDRLYWSARLPGAIRRRLAARPARGLFDGAEGFDILGRRLKSLPGPGRYPR